ncbi:carboxypeptidase regulatory-like domain-containing protein, partial [bacterium]
MRKLVVYIFFILWSVLYSASSSILKGTVQDAQTGKPLDNVNVSVEGTSLGSATDKNGRFQITIALPGTYTVKASRIDYEPKTLKNIMIQSGQQREIVFKLNPRIIEMKPIQVEADKFTLKYQTEVARIGFQQISPTQIKTLAGGMDDITRSVQIFGSVMPASDYNAYFAVRGGSPEQNLVVMDGITIPNPYRFRLLLGGGLSIFDPNTTEDVRLHIGGFSAEFGNFLSSVLEVDTREGNRHRFSGRASMNLIDASA